MSTFEPKVRYCVAEQREGHDPTVRDWESFREERHARSKAEGYNGDEAELARMERSEVRTRFFVVKATTTYEEI